MQASGRLPLALDRSAAGGGAVAPAPQPGGGPPQEAQLLGAAGGGISLRLGLLHLLHRRAGEDLHHLHAPPALGVLHGATGIAGSRGSLPAGAGGRGRQPNARPAPCDRAARSRALCLPTMLLAPCIAAGRAWEARDDPYDPCLAFRLLGCPGPACRVGPHPPICIPWGSHALHYTGTPWGFRKIK